MLRILTFPRSAKPAAHSWKRPLQKKSKKQRKYLPMVPPFGINGLSLAAGMNAYCAFHRLPWRFRWNVTKRDLFSLIR